MKTINFEKSNNRITFTLAMSESEFNEHFIRCDDCGSVVPADSTLEYNGEYFCDNCTTTCFNWGIGRELYTAPFIYVPAEKCNISNGRCFDRFVIERIKTIGRYIVGLSIVNLSLKTDNPKEKRCFVWTKEGEIFFMIITSVFLSYIFLYVN